MREYFEHAELVAFLSEFLDVDLAAESVVSVSFERGGVEVRTSQHFAYGGGAGSVERAAINTTVIRVKPPAIITTSA